MRGKLSGVYVKNFIAVVMLLCLGILILGAAFAGMSYSYIVRQRTETMLETGANAGSMVRAYYQQTTDSVTSVGMRSLLVWISRISGFHIMITDGEGMVLNCSDSELDCPHIGAAVPAAALKTINGRGRYAGVTALGGAFEQRRYVTGIALPAGPMRGYVFVSEAPGQMGGIWRSFADIFVAAALFVVSGSFVAAYAVVRKQARPIKEMCDAARSYGRGDFEPRVSTEGRHDEVSELAEAFNAMADSLERSERSRRELIANVSHELKTPMTTIAGFTDAILDGAVPKERETEYLQIISSETKRLSRLVRGMLNMSQLQSVTPMELGSKSFDILEVICETLLSLERKITDRGLDVETVLPEEPIYTVGDRDSITQVVHNLLDNAAKFADLGSTITVKLWREEGKAYVSVANRGETIPKEELPLIFERFHKTDKSRSMDRDGVGLGLYIVKTILDSHASRIYVTSRDGLTTFVFDLKLAKNRPSNERDTGNQ